MYKYFNGKKYYCIHPDAPIYQCISEEQAEEMRNTKCNFGWEIGGKHYSTKQYNAIFTDEAIEADMIDDLRSYFLKDERYVAKIKRDAQSEFAHSLGLYKSSLDSLEIESLEQKYVLQMSYVDKLYVLKSRGYDEEDIKTILG